MFITTSVISAHDITASDITGAAPVCECVHLFPSVWQSSLQCWKAWRVTSQIVLWAGY